MKRSGKALVCMLGGFVLCTGGNAITADTSGNPYDAIVERNVFGLKPIPPVVPPEPPKPPTPKMTLTGIMTLGGSKRALFKVQMPPKPPKPAGEESFILREGEREGDVEVVEIDEAAGSIKVKYLDILIPVTFDKDIKASSAAAPGAPPPNPFAAPPQPTPAANPFAPQGGGNPGIKNIPTRQLRLPQPGGQGSATPGMGLPAFGGAGVQQQASFQSQPQFSQEEETILIEAERQRLKDKGDPLAGLMPLTRITPVEDRGTIPGQEPPVANTAAAPTPATPAQTLPPIGRPVPRPY